MVGQVVRVTTTAMMTPMHRALLALSLAAVVTLTACGGDSEDTDTLSGDEQKAARSLAAEFQGNQPTAAQRDSGICLGKALVSTAGVKKLVSSGMLTEDLAINAELPAVVPPEIAARSEEHTSELQSLMRISYAVFCLKKKTLA